MPHAAVRQLVSARRKLQDILPAWQRVKANWFEEQCYVSTSQLNGTSRFSANGYITNWALLHQWVCNKRITIDITIMIVTGTHSCARVRKRKESRGNYGISSMSLHQARKPSLSHKSSDLNLAVFWRNVPILCSFESKPELVCIRYSALYQWQSWKINRCLVTYGKGHFSHWVRHTSESVIQ